MRLRLGCRFEHEASSPTPAVVLVEPHLDAAAGIVAERWSSEPARRRRRASSTSTATAAAALLLPEGASTFSYDALVDRRPEPEPVPGPDDVQHRVEDLPGRAAALAARKQALRVRRAGRPGVGAVRRHRAGRRARAGGLRLDPRQRRVRRRERARRRPTIEIFERRGGMCRDFAHLGVTFCRALGIPARYVFGYMPDIGIPGPYPPMDFHAWFEVWLGDRAGGRSTRASTRPASGALPIGRGRDAVDVAMVTTYGAG